MICIFFLKTESFLRIIYYLCAINIELSMEETRDLNRLKVILAEKKKTNKWLAEQLGCAPTTVSKWCNNSSQPSLESIEKIANLLDIDYTELIRIDRKP